MPIRPVFTNSQGALLESYSSRLSEAIVRNRAALEVRAAHVEAELAIKSRSEFLANMNHELRTPLNAIIGFATMLRDAGEYGLGEEQQKSYAEYILQSGDLLLGHINTILEVAALESGAVSVEDGRIDCCRALNGALERIKIRAAAADVQVDRLGDSDGFFAWGDEDRFAQAIDHILQTAVKSCGKNGRVIAKVDYDENGWPEIAVRDNGAGLNPEELKDALEAFKQAHRGLDRSFSGPGVGLAVAKTFLEMQGGKFQIKSREGQGTLVRIALPKPTAAQEYELTAKSGADAPETMTRNVEAEHDAA